MFNKKSCSRCKANIKSSHDFCPSCGFQLKPSSNFGLLGKNDLIENNNPLPTMGGGIMGKMLTSAMKMLEKEMLKGMQDSSQGKQPKMRLMINGQEINSPNQKEKKPTKHLPINFSKENLEKWRKLSKKEPVSNMKRFEDKIEYELNIPGVESIKDISIINLENSLEVKAIAKKQGYFKAIPFNLPLKKFTLLKGILTLEMDARSQNS